ncbi:phosphoribosyl-ATP pyrophosphohydrolase [Kaistia hirudinis]|uniref:Phosphoribosyl-ATP pyrophosphatase n=1 Tax=Kaistia hirudinis TaxID=1293440 RepID=A0A840APS6_9HYPH|nr:phosphoribosyl-ATP pyrophosphohydrolase [Kaistia hirudinis]
MSEFSLDDLAAIVKRRAYSDDASSYTAKLMAKGPARIAKKFGEEAVEAVIAAVEGDRDALVSETADVLYHLAVLLESRGVAFDAVFAELARRTGQTGLEEKASRPAE